MPVFQRMPEVAYPGITLWFWQIGWNWQWLRDGVKYGNRDYQDCDCHLPWRSQKISIPEVQNLGSGEHVILSRLPENQYQTDCKSKSAMESNVYEDDLTGS
mmetsp:Transcript_2342/g.5049  ORF Transcript_2342/g.5049 Transcript_2342/m.5049 type:complete len:101 (+) Transcript_2342:588-890(+)